MNSIRRLFVMNAITCKTQGKLTYGIESLSLLTSLNNQKNNISSNFIVKYKIHAKS